ncbi:hypothetical protein H5T87_11290 [bacterium]|nr:hypothetical protein [bacterium]
MKQLKKLSFLLLIFLMVLPLFPSDLYWISLENKQDGMIKVSLNQGLSWVTIGKVLKPGHGSVKGFLASKWGKRGTVVAASSYAIHIKVSESEVISILSKEMESLPKDFGGQQPGDAGILTDIRAGTLLFKDLAPLVGSKVCLRESSALKELPDSFSLQGGEELYIIVEPREFPQGIVIENKMGGNVYLIKEGKRQVVGKVEKPLTGIGRFDGTEFTGIGRINTVHPGAITVSTVPAGAKSFDINLSGGFQIVPIENAKEGYFASSPPYLIVSPLEGEIAGSYPLFDGTIGLWDFGGNGFRVEVSWNGNEWEEIPLLKGKIDDLASYLNKSTKGKYRTAFSYIGIIFPRIDITKAIKEVLKGKIMEEMRIVRGKLDIEVRLEGEGAKIVDLKIDGKLRAVKNYYPFVFTIDLSDLSEGEHIVEVSAKDENGDVLASKKQKIYVDNQGLFKD